MKLIAIDLEPPPTPLRTFLGGLQSAPPNTLQRWWFRPDERCLRVAADRRACALLGRSVRLSTEDLAIGTDGRIICVACAAHARRKVFNARVNHPTHAAVLLSMFHRLYDIEDRAKSLSAADRQGLRQDRAKPPWERMREYIHGDTVQDVPPKDSFGQALTYLRNQFDPLLVYLDHGLMPIDSNETEQLMKQVAIGRKNWLSIGDIEPGYRAADQLSLVSIAGQAHAPLPHSEDEGESYRLQDTKRRRGPSG